MGPHRSQIAGPKSKYGKDGEVFTKLLQNVNAKIDISNLKKDLKTLQSVGSFQELCEIYNVAESILSESLSFEENINDNDEQFEEIMDSILDRNILTMDLRNNNDSSPNEYHENEEKDEEQINKL